MRTYASIASLHDLFRAYPWEEGRLDRVRLGPWMMRSLYVTLSYRYVTLFLRDYVKKQSYMSGMDAYNSASR